MIDVLCTDPVADRTFFLDQPSAFDEAVKGVDAILHTASPFHWAADDPKGAQVSTHAAMVHV